MKQHSAFLQLYYHIVLGTKSRLPLITPELEPLVYQALTAKCTDLDIRPLAINGTEDHVHLLLEIPPTLTIAEVARQLMGATAATTKRHPLATLVWQESYGAVTIRANEIDKIAEYVRRQREHHAADTTVRVLERQSGQ